MHALSLAALMISVSASMPLGALAQQSSLRAWPEYQVIMWQGGSAAKQPVKFPLYYQRLYEMGVSVGMVYGDGDLKPVLAAKIPYYVENMVNRGLCLKFSSKVTDWDAFVAQWKNDRSEDQCVRDYSLDDPEWQNWARKQVQDLVRKNQDHAPLLHDLRDELSTTISANSFDYDFHPLALNGFRDWLKTQYPSLDILNAEWETSFASWDDVRPMTTDRIKNRMARIQAAWLLESTVDGSTWLRRFSSYEAAHNPHARVRHGWLKMLKDAGYDPVFVSTQQIEAGELSRYKALVLPQSWVMSDAEATRITEFMDSADGPHAILADGQVGLFDEHGRLRTIGALDPMIAPSSAASAVVRRLDKPVPRDNVSFEASPAAYANAEAGDGREQTSGWVEKIRNEWLQHVPLTVVVPAVARVKVWKYTLPPAKNLPADTSPIRLLAFERNITYRMGEDLQQSADNSAMKGAISITAKLPAPKHVYDLRAGKYLGRSAELTLNVSSDMPTLVAVSDVMLPEENLVEQLLTLCH